MITDKWEEKRSEERDERTDRHWCKKWWFTRVANNRISLFVDELNEISVVSMGGWFVLIAPTTRRVIGRHNQLSIHVFIYRYVWVYINKFYQDAIEEHPQRNGELLSSDTPPPPTGQTNSINAQWTRAPHHRQTRNGCRGVMEHKAKINPISELERKHQVSLDKIVSK